MGLQLLVETVLRNRFVSFNVVALFEDNFSKLRTEVIFPFKLSFNRKKALCFQLSANLKNDQGFAFTLRLGFKSKTLRNLVVSYTLRQKQIKQVFCIYFYVHKERYKRLVLF